MERIDTEKEQHIRELRVLAYRLRNDYPVVSTHCAEEAADAVEELIALLAKGEDHNP